MTYLELVQEAIRESGVSTEIPSTLTGVTGITDKFKRWVNSSWKELQLERPDWYFREEEQTIRNLDGTYLEDGVRVPTSLMPSTANPSWHFINRYDVYVRKQSDEISKPTNTSPSDGATENSSPITLQASSFDVKYGSSDTHAASRWIVYDADTGQIFADSGVDDSNLTSYSVSGFVLMGSYRWKVRYKGEKYGWSDWSDETTFDTLIGGVE